MASLGRVTYCRCVVGPHLSACDRAAGDSGPVTHGRRFRGRPEPAARSRQPSPEHPSRAGRPPGSTLFAAHTPGAAARHRCCPDAGAEARGPWNHFHGPLASYCARDAGHMRNPWVRKQPFSGPVGHPCVPTSGPTPVHEQHSRAGRHGLGRAALGGGAALPPRARTGVRGTEDPGKGKRGRGQRGQAISAVPPDPRRPSASAGPRVSPGTAA